jgi:hypothetical protein
MPDETATTTPADDPAKDYLRSRGYTSPKDLDEAEAANLAERSKVIDQSVSNLQGMQTSRARLLRDTVGGVAPPNLAVAGEPPKQQLQDPFKVFQNPAVLIATLGSLMTRAPATAALNAGASAMEAQRKGDIQAYEAARENWKDKTEQIKEINEKELAKYEAIWKNKQLAVSEKLAKLNGLSAASRDEIMIAGLQTGRLDRIDAILEARRKANTEIVKSLEMDDMHRATADLARARTQQIQQLNQGGGPLNPDTARFMARQMIGGNYSALTGLFQQKGAKAQIEAASRQILMEEKGMSEEEAADYITDRVAKFQGTKAYQTTAGRYGARVETATNEVEQLVPQALETSKALPRGRFVPINQLLQAYQKGTSDPAYNDFAIANFSLINAYTRAMNPTGTPHVNDRLEQHAQGILSLATSPQAYEVQVRRLWKEVQASKAAVAQTKEGLGKAKEFPGDAEGADEGWGELKVH